MLENIGMVSTWYYLFLLAIVVAIAIYVNRQRDSTGKVSFVNKCGTGFIGIRIYEIRDGNRTTRKVLPLWVPEKKLLLHLNTVLPKGDFEIEACWEPHYYGFLAEMFLSVPVESTKPPERISDIHRFRTRATMRVEFDMEAEGNQVRITSPQADKFIPTENEAPFPLILKDPALRSLPARIRHARKPRKRKKELWLLEITDPAVIAELEQRIKAANRKMDGLIIKNRELESSLDKTIKVDHT